MNKQLDQACKDNPELPRSFVSGVLAGMDELIKGDVRKYRRRKPKSDGATT